GVPVEVMVQLANTLGADPWFCLPHRADDDYVRAFATIVRDRLDPGRKAYVEYSNETWNHGYEQGRYATQRGRALNLSTNDTQAGLFYQARRATQVFALWEQVFGGRERFVRVLGGQTGSVWAGEQVLGFENSYRRADAIAIAPYFQCTSL